MYCSNCGAKVESDALHCPYCGKSFMHASKDLMTEKDLKIEALERKLLSLEQQLGKKQKEKNENKIQIIIFIFAFLIFFSFLLFFALMVIFR